MEFHKVCCQARDHRRSRLTSGRQRGEDPVRQGRLNAVIDSDGEAKRQSALQLKMSCEAFLFFRGVGLFLIGDTVDRAGLIIGD